MTIVEVSYLVYDCLTGIGDSPKCATVSKPISHHHLPPHLPLPLRQILFQMLLIKPQNIPLRRLTACEPSSFFACAINANSSSCVITHSLFAKKPHTRTGSPY